MQHSSSPFRYLDVDRRGSVEYVVINRPEVHNAFNDEVVAELAAWCRAAGEAFPELRVVVLSGRGRVFSAGADLTWMSRTLEHSCEECRADAARLAKMLQALDSLPQAVVAPVHGAAIAGGIGLVAACDIAVASEEAQFGFSETRLGIVPAVISPFVITKIGVSAARELSLCPPVLGLARLRTRSGACRLSHRAA
jgi:methylglutaconyl-CoA hydratase